MGKEMAAERDVEGSIIFATVGRCSYAFDVFSLPSTLRQPGALEASMHHLSLQPHTGLSRAEELRHTYGKSVCYNGHAVEHSQWDFVLSQAGGEALERVGRESLHLVGYVSEDGGAPQIHFSLSGKAGGGDDHVDIEWGAPSPALRDKPSVAGSRLVFVSTEEPSKNSRDSWNAVYSTDLKTRATVRLTPQGVADFSPALSPSGEWVAVATTQGRRWKGEIEGLCADIYVCDAVGGNRRLVVEDGGWPTWADDHTLFFHRQADDSWWSVFKVDISPTGPNKVVRVTPPGLHAFTPAASQVGNWIAVATRRHESDYRHIETFDLQTNTFHPLTSLINPYVHHYNPFIFPESERVGYHRCRDVLKPASSDESGSVSTIVPNLEPLLSPIPSLALLRINGAFPTVSPDGSMIAFISLLGFQGVYVMNMENGSGRRKVYHQTAFGAEWDTIRKGVLYTSVGPIFASEDRTVHIAAILNADTIDLAEGVTNPKVKILTKPGTQNNAFPSVSPDGKYIVFRSGRSGHKNLYVMDAEEGESKYLRQLTEGAWTDTMPNWAPNNEWIAFSSDRENPGKRAAEGSFSLYYIHPDCTGLHKVIESIGGGKVNHPWFSPDSKSILFTSDIAGVSAEPISVPQQFQPYGDLFVAKSDGTQLLRLTHNAYENGTPTWGCKFISKFDLADEGELLHDSFTDVNFLKRTESENPPKRICGRP